MNIEILQTRRKKLIEKLENNEMVVIFASAEPKYPRYFLQEKNFFYLTNLEIPNAILILAKQKNKTFSQLFIERNDPKMAVWIGEKMTPSQAGEISGIKRISYLDEFENSFTNIANTRKKCYLNYKKTQRDQPLCRAKVFTKNIKEHFPYLIFDSVDELIRSLRECKDEWEIKQLQKAIDITGKGIEKIMKNAIPGMMEYELEALLNYEAQRNGLRHMGFKSIIASGKNAATLHYEENNCKIGEKDLILLDVGTACNNYSAD
ncbi:MAG: aminopeptidase P N-terminal domain-containing protein, partial [Candidatus Cloacimonadota bacterium]|nr:aminopeptidase P N-terminal domain-containing protein [Candidatus Cloacimonadota bacterium]